MNIKGINTCKKVIRLTVSLIVIFTAITLNFTPLSASAETTIIDNFTSTTGWSNIYNSSITQYDATTAKITCLSSAYYGAQQKAFTYNVDANPILVIKVPQVGGGSSWGLKVNNGGSDINIVAATTGTGVLSFNLKMLTGWSGDQNINVRIFPIGGSGAFLLVDYIGVDTAAVLDTCDNNSGWAGTNPISVDTTNKKQGAGSLTRTGNGIAWFQKTYSTAVNSGVSESDGYMHMWLYVSDATKLTTNGQIEITSAGQSDSNEYSWSFGSIGLVSGWNELFLKISNATKIGAPNLSALNYFRIYDQLSASITCKVDDLYFFSERPLISIPASDANIKYYGRWSIGETERHSNWGGAYFKVDFTGSHVKLKLGGAAKVVVKIDDNADVYYQSATGGIVDLTPTALISGRHSLRVASMYHSESIKFDGLQLDIGAQTMTPTTNANIIEFAGDSITAGYHLDPGLVSGDATLDYAWLTAEELGCEHTQIAYSGICLVNGYNSYVLNPIGLEMQFFKLQTIDYTQSPDWDFSKYQARAVVINIGTNDYYQAKSDAAFENSYTTFLQNIRAKYPNARIFVMKTFGGYKVPSTMNAVIARINSGDYNIQYIDTTGWLIPSDYIDGVHPTAAGHQKIAGFLKAILAPYVD